jgi:hypothetical protein
VEALEAGEQRNKFVGRGSMLGMTHLLESKLSLL